MLTPQEVMEKTFDKAVFGGYDMSAVDAFLDALTQDYSVLYKENAALKSKLKVLVDTVEEYRAVDESMRKALLAAQRMADEQVLDARRERERLLSQASEEAMEISLRLKKDNEAEVRRHGDLKQQAFQFLQELKQSLQSQMLIIETSLADAHSFSAEEYARQVVAAAVPSAPAWEEEPPKTEDAIFSPEVFNEIPEAAIAFPGLEAQFGHKL